MEPIVDNWSIPTAPKPNISSKFVFHVLCELGLMGEFRVKIES